MFPQPRTGPIELLKSAFGHPNPPAGGPPSIQHGDSTGGIHSVTAGGHVAELVSEVRIEGTRCAPEMEKPSPDIPRALRRACAPWRDGAKERPRHSWSSCGCENHAPWNGGGD